MGVAEQFEELEADGHPDRAGEGMPAPQVPPGKAAASAAAAGAGTGLVIKQDGSQGGEGARVVPGAFQIGERVPDRANHPALMRSGSQPGHRLI